jgi:hypothetical protein
MSGYPGFGGSSAVSSTGYPHVASPQAAADAALLGVAYGAYPTAAAPYPGASVMPQPRQSVAASHAPMSGASYATSTVVGVSAAGTPTGAAITTTTIAGVKDYDVAFEDGVAREQIPEREIFDFDKYDISSNPPIGCMLEAKTASQSQLQTALYCFALFNSITTIMVIVNSFKTSATQDVIESFGSQWIGLTSLMIYGPLAFFLLIVLAVNNYFSERVWYAMLGRGILVDFPQSGEFGYLFTSWQPLVFMVLYLAYLLLSVAVLIKGKANVGTVLTFITNMVVGVLLWWYRMQSIEYQFVSLSDWIMTFPQRDAVNKTPEERQANREKAVMDEMNLKHAAFWMKRVVLNCATQPCWSGFMRNYSWKASGAPFLERAAFHLGMWACVGGLIAACVAYFAFLGKAELAAVWANQVSPCITACGNVSSAIAPAAFTNATCGGCMCACLRNYHRTGDDFLAECATAGALAVASVCTRVGATVASMCAVAKTCGKV